MPKYKNKKIKLNSKTYILRRELGAGGNACVWNAISDDGSEYAIKFLKNAEDCKKVERFKKEIDFCKHANHPNILKVYDEGEFQGELFYVMPVCKCTLRTVISGENNYLKLLEYAIDLGKAILYIHNQKVTHRDIKPENVFIDENGVVILGDFGIAHFVDSNLTSVNDWLGNKNYASPEQLLMKNADKITAAADIYAYGLILNELFTKKKPSGMHFEEISDHYPHLQPLDEIVQRCLVQEPLARPNIVNILMDLQLFRAGLLKELETIKECILFNEDTDYSEDEIDIVANRASIDILFAKNLLWQSDERKLNRYNCNYHREIHYSVDNFIKNLFFQKKLLNYCQRKFNHEAYNYTNADAPYQTLDLNNEADLVIYKSLKQLLDKYRLGQDYQSITGQILKLFLSCANNHCSEILREIPRLEHETADLDDAPILYIIYALRCTLEKKELEEIDISEYLKINWQLTEFDVVEGELYKVEDESRKNLVLRTFVEKWNVQFEKIENGHYSVKFSDKDTYRAFKEHALKLSKPNYIFEGDVLDLTRIYREFEGILELKPLDSFDVTSTLAKILGLRKDY